MSRYSLHNIALPNTHFKSSVTWGGGGGGGSSTPTTYTSELPELKGSTFNSEADKVEAEKKVVADRKAMTDYQAKVEQAVGSVNTTGLDEIAAAQLKQRAMQSVAVPETKYNKEQIEEYLAGQNKTFSGQALDAAARHQAQLDTGRRQLTSQAITDPSSLVTKADVSTIDPNAAGTTIAEGTGQLTTPAPQITDPDAFQAAKVDPTKVAGAVQQQTSQLQAAQGQVSQQAQVQAQTTDPTQMASLQVNPAQIAQAQQVAPTPPRVIQQGELISGSAVDMAAVDAATQVQAAQADPTAAATVQGQMADLMADFEGSEPPAWAAGALRNATAQMAARGLGASSMAGQALVQAAMESALPIAMQDAQTTAQFELTNLSNRQQTAMFAAQQRAQFLGMKFDQQFQTRVANAARIADVANMNFTAEQQIALENARMAQTVDITNLNAVNAKIMADAAAMSQMEMANLNNRQQAAVANAKAFLAMDMKNLDFQQQTNMFKAQQNIQAIFSDQAAENAAKQFNAASENQTNQFFANMSTQVQQFNAGMKVQRDQFNAQNALVVAQANAQWRQNVETLNTAAQNEANRNEALAANQFTQSTMDQIWQRERDIMDYAFRQSESASDRALSVFLSDKSDEMQKWKTGQEQSGANMRGIGMLLGRMIV